MTKRCSKCGVEKSLEDFGKRIGATDGHKGVCKVYVNSRANERYMANADEKRAISRARYAANRDQYREYGMRWTQRHPDKVRQRWLKYQHNMTAEEWSAQFVKQGGVCMICGRAEELHVDHSHSTGKRRGLLCGSCNRALGILKEDRRRMAMMIAYLCMYEDDNTPMSEQNAQATAAVGQSNNMMGT